MVRRLHREAHGEGDPRAERARAALAEALAPTVFSEPAFPRASPEPPFAPVSDSLRELVGEAERDDQAGGLDGEAEARVEQLTDRLRADPTDVAVAQELAALLERLGRDLELVALLSAQLEEAPAESHASLAEARRAALLRLAAAARARGAASEASLYESMASG